MFGSFIKTLANETTVYQLQCSHWDFDFPWLSRETILDTYSSSNNYKISLELLSPPVCHSYNPSPGFFVIHFVHFLFYFPSFCSAGLLHTVRSTKFK